jgi:hypothetical protein
MDRFSAAAQVAAFFLLIASPLALAQRCEDCERVSHDPPVTGSVDVTAAVDAATSFVIKALRSLHPAYKVSIVEGDAIDAAPTVAEYAAAYDARDGRSKDELPGFRHRYAWQLTYRDQDPAALSQLEPGERSHGTDVKLDDSWVLGLRFELDYGWKR